MSAITSQPDALFSLTMAQAILPQLIIAFGIVLGLLLVAWRRTQQIIVCFTALVLVLALIANISLYGTSTTQVTQLLLVDANSSFALSLVLISALVALRMSYRFLKAHIEVHDEYYLLLLLVVFAAGILVTSDHFASLFLGFELLSISLVGLVGYQRESQYSVESGFKYLILSAAASSFMLLGMAFIYSVSGDMSFNANLSNAIYHQQGLGLFFQLGLLLLLSGIVFKLSLAPFHFWTPDVYQGAPTPVTLLMATVSKLAMFVVLVKCFVAQRYLLLENVQLFLISFAIISMLLGNVMALRQQNLKRLLAYSSVAHMGYLLIILIVTSEQSLAFSWQSILFYLAAYTLANLSIFMVIALLQQYSSDAPYQEDILLTDLQGLFWRAPSYGLLMILALLSLAGIPLTMGFIGKFYILSHATIAHAWWLIAILIFASAIALAYYLPIIFKILTAKANDPQHMPLKKQHLIEQALVYALVVISLFFGILPEFVNQFIHS
ncbi:NADH dehydrogenase subunit N [Colwellia chukchiensis]|uniref:NADH-quinone oxidoreductase subunit N n=1 Tax=Colwellia chukchiensis TaxID=641665 RepID=A0A1H7H4C1_9GAMM|nr:NADH-quinone oxidoreductase subunit N [Colwellia chukchiensis]SEK43800.1 NADH dehydrogenase subunit N [Colwellia chukchiensis]